MGDMVLSIHGASIGCKQMILKSIGRESGRVSWHSSANGRHRVISGLSRDTRTTPRSANNSESRSSRLGYLSKSSPGANCVGLTKMDATTKSFSRRAASTSDKWPTEVRKDKKTKL
jgi:hypothetical protein